MQSIIGYRLLVYQTIDTQRHPETTEDDYCVGNVISDNGTSVRRLHNFSTYISF